MSVQDVSDQEPPTLDAGGTPAVEAPAPPSPFGFRDRARDFLRTTRVVALVIAKTVLSGAFGIALVLGLVNGGLDLAPTLGAAPVAAAEAPQRPPVIPPMVPEGARRDWAMFSYVEKINQAWGHDWPMVIRLFEDFDARYPGEPMVKDKLYASYIEDGRVLQWQGDIAGARRRYEQAARYDPTRPEAGDFLAQLEKEQGGH